MQMIVIFESFERIGRGARLNICFKISPNHYTEFCQVVEENSQLIVKGNMAGTMPGNYALLYAQCLIHAYNIVNNYNYVEQPPIDYLAQWESLPDGLSHMQKV